MDYVHIEFRSNRFMSKVFVYILNLYLATILEKKKMLVIWNWNKTLVCIKYTASFNQIMNMIFMWNWNFWMTILLYQNRGLNWLKIIFIINIYSPNLVHTGLLYRELTWWQMSYCMPIDKQSDCNRSISKEINLINITFDFCGKKDLCSKTELIHRPSDFCSYTLPTST